MAAKVTNVGEDLVGVGADARYRAGGPIAGPCGRGVRLVFTRQLPK